MSPASQPPGSKPGEPRGRIYADNNATTRPDPRVVEAMRLYQADVFGNASSVHRFGREARGALDDARGALAQVLRVEPGEVVFTSSGSEANSLAIRGVRQRDKGTPRIVVSSIEHPSVLESVKALVSGGSITVDWIPPDRSGRIDAGRFISALGDDTYLASLMAANNETGALQPVAEVGAACRARGIPFHVDAVQAFGKTPFFPKEIPCDLASFASHKIHGPKGSGALFVRRGLSLDPLVAGHQERGRRGGTEDVAACVGFGIAARLATDTLGVTSARLDSLRLRLEARVLAGLPQTRVHGLEIPRIANTANFGFPGADGESILIALDMKGIAVSTGAACSSGSLAPSHVLLAMGIPAPVARGSIRVSLSRETTEAEVDAIAAALTEAVTNATPA